MLGRYLDPVYPAPEDFEPWAIAHALALTNRYCGHTREPYSVAQHCCLIADRVPVGDRLQALLHDATEAFLSDLNGHLKTRLPDYAAVEERANAAMCARFGVAWRLPDSVHMMDRKICLNEMRDLFEVVPPAISPPIAGLLIRPWHWRRAEAEWLCRFERYSQGIYAPPRPWHVLSTWWGIVRRSPPELHASMLGHLY